MTTTGTEQARKHADRLHDEGHTMSEIARRLDLAESTVRRWYPNPKDTGRAAEMKAMVESGMTLQEVGDHYGISRSAVHQVVGTLDRRRPKRGVRRTVSLSHGTWEGLRQEAGKHGFTPYGDRPSIDTLLDAIGAGDLVVRFRPGRENPQPITRGQRLSINLSEARWAGLARIAARLRLRDEHGAGDPIQLIDRIGQGDMILEPKPNVPTEAVHAGWKA